MCIVLICNTYGYFLIRVSSVTHMGDLNKYKSCNISISPVVPTGTFV